MISLRVPVQRTLIASLLAVAFSVAQAESMKGVVAKTVVSNPEVLNKWHQFKAAGHERDVSWGRYLPTLDVLFGQGYKREESPTLPASKNGKASYSFDTEKVTLRQNLFEGFATANDTVRLEHAAMVRFYETLDLTESAALEAAKAYVDVWRYRQLVAFAEESYATHRVLYEKIRERAETGVGRKVDLETAAGRLALSESNLLTETSNLHDVTARYQRIVGALPPADLDPPPSSLLKKAMPKDRADGINRSFATAPSLKAAYQNILSAQRNTDVQKAGYWPRVDAYAEVTRDSSINGQGYNGSATTEKTVAVTATWNLFNGLRDQAKERKAAEEANSAKDVREKVCRDVRQNSAMAYNDFLRLTEQLQYLDQHQLSTDKAREAFRRQFDIGQRTLLDVLDTENEYYTARRNYLNAELDLELAKVRYLATEGTLLKVLDLERLDMTPPRSLEEVADKSEFCPPEHPVAYVKPSQPDRFVLLPEADGKIGEVEITRQDGKSTILNSAYAAAQSNNRKLDTGISSSEEVKDKYSVLFYGDQRAVKQYTLRFELGKTSLVADSKAQLKKILDEFKNEPVTLVLVSGHADKVGNAKVNQEISKKRAEAVGQLLLKGGVPKSKLKTTWKGDTDPLPDTAGKVVEPRNRRVEIRFE